MTADFTALGRSTWRKRLGAHALRNLFEGLAELGKLHPRANPARHGVVVERNIRFGDGATDVCDIYRPEKAAGPLPTALYLHGGGFQILSKDTHWVFGLALARHGYMAVLPDYRLAPQHPYPAGLTDASRSLLWLWENLSSLGGDKDRFVVGGESAGANFTMSLAIAACARRPEPFAAAVYDADVRIKALLPLCGILELDNPGRFKERWPHINRVVHDRVEETARRYLHGGGAGPSSLANPLAILESDTPFDRPLPPVFMSVGTKDPLLDDVRRAAAALTRRGVTNEAKYYEGGLHAFQAFVWQERARQSWRDLYAFLDTHAGSR